MRNVWAQAEGQREHPERLRPGLLQKDNASGAEEDSEKGVKREQL